MRALLSALSLLLASCPCFCFAWTTGEWLGVVEASAGTVVLRPRTSPSSDICENCSGTGRLGDGTVSVECPVCEGTGKPVKPGEAHVSHLLPKQHCASCAPPATMKASPTPSGMKAPAVKQEAASSGGGTYKRGLFRRR